MNLMDIFVKLTVEKSGFKADMKEAENAVKDLGDKSEGSVSKVSKLSTALKGGLVTAAKAGAVAVAALTTATAKLTKASVESYAEYEQLVGGVKTLFGEMAGADVEKNAMKAFETAGLSANQYMETVTSFSAALINSLGGDTEKAAKVADEAIIGMSDNANKMGTSMEMIQNAYQGFAKQNYTMLDNLNTMGALAA